MDESLKSIRDAVQAKVSEEAKNFPPVETKAQGLSPHFIAQCLECEELGLGILYSLLLCGRVVFDNTRERWLIFKEHYWDFDLMHQAEAMVEEVVNLLLDELTKISMGILEATKHGDEETAKGLRYKERLLNRRIKFLRSDRGRTVCLKMARTCREPLAIRGDTLDQVPYLLACQNGVIDLRTAKFRPGRPDDWLTKASPTLWHGLEAPAPVFENFLLEIFDGDSELIDFIQRLFGYSISGWQREHKFVVLEGEGRNGKSTLIETLRHVLGPLALPIQSEMLLNQGRFRSSSGPSPDVMALLGIRLAFASESDLGRRYDHSRVQWLSGGDSIVARDIQSKQVCFEPTHHLFLITNHKPGADPTAYAFWERMLLIPFRLAFVDREPIKEHERSAKKNLREMLKEEASGILAWLVRGCVEYQRHGLNPPKVVLEATAQYRRSEDVVADFLMGRTLKDPLAKVSAKDLYDAFCDWYKENLDGKTIISQRRFGDLMRNRFEKSQPGGRVYYNGLLLKRIWDSGGDS